MNSDAARDIVDEMAANVLRALENAPATGALSRLTELVARRATQLAAGGVMSYVDGGGSVQTAG